jgi:hypothetical protein
MPKVVPINVIGPLNDFLYTKTWHLRLHLQLHDYVLQMTTL